MSGEENRGTGMSAWPAGERGAIASRDELEITSRRRDGTLRAWVTIWVVGVGDDLYVRSVNGPDASWFRGTRARHEGRLRSGAVERGVAFEDAAADVQDAVDAAYRTKYARYAAHIVDSIVAPRARATTIRLVRHPPE